ncbi:GNAT family N-acetyltransferase [Pseudonocardia xinjiangensis]|uniref:GNAT family N-acetyltransferase n=1 Tax=Pseudonocardia xinjiangensis TaxID=75289 RepID=A0ABX1RFC5_9PSEU|nr:GNAT family N-acetyltransferase [Pseudonocardia xinjiangensis]NMH79108.1 GNAT family N-acetyltransferase [Pseudonocardia xinjiangensis]
MADRTGSGPPLGIRVADERDVVALAQLRRAWLEERAGRPVEDPGFEAAFEQWWRVELPRRTFWLAEVGTPRSGFTAIGSINVVEIVHMPRPGTRGGRIGHVGNAFVLAAFADRGVPAALLSAALEHARERRYRRLLLAPTSGSAAFYRRAGFASAGEQLLMLDPSTLPAPPPP